MWICYPCLKNKMRGWPIKIYVWFLLKTSTIWQHWACLSTWCQSAGIALSLCMGSAFSLYRLSALCQSECDAKARWLKQCSALTWPSSFTCVICLTSIGIWNVLPALSHTISLIYHLPLPLLPTKADMKMLVQPWCSCSTKHLPVGLPEGTQSWDYLDNFCISFLNYPWELSETCTSHYFLMKNVPSGSQ